MIKDTYATQKHWGYWTTVHELVKRGYNIRDARKLYNDSPMDKLVDQFGYDWFRDTNPQENADWVIEWSQMPDNKKYGFLHQDYLKQA